MPTVIRGIGALKCATVPTTTKFSHVAANANDVFAELGVGLTDSFFGAKEPVFVWCRVVLGSLIKLALQPI